MRSSKELRDYRGARICGENGLDEATKLLVEQKHASKTGHVHGGRRMRSLKQAKLSQKEDVMAAGWALRRGTSLNGLAAFARAKPTRPLREGEERYYQYTHTLPATIQAHLFCY